MSFRENILEIGLKRKIYDSLKRWKGSSKGTTALLIDGARRVGKSYIAEEFAKNEYKSYILIDFSYPKPGTTECFKEDIYDLDLFFSNSFITSGVIVGSTSYF